MSTTPAHGPAEVVTQRAESPLGAGIVPVVAILRRLRPERALEVGHSLADAGIAALELTIDSPNAFDVIRQLRRERPDLTVGAGTVLEAEQALRAMDAGAQFIVSPNVDEQVISVTSAAGIASLPGAATPTEVIRAWRAGAALVKIFPAGALGPSAVHAMKEPLPMIPLIAVGGINGGNARQFLDAGACAVGIGSWLASEGDADRASRRATQLIAALRLEGTACEPAISHL